MKRSKPLQRKTPLRSNGKGLKKAPLAKVSKKQAKRLATYSKVRQKVLTEEPFCRRCGAVATDTHHSKGRGIHLDDKDSLISLCRPCHDWCHTFPNKAREEGYILKPDQ
jgi:hypothetical protein